MDIKRDNLTLMQGPMTELLNEYFAKTVAKDGLPPLDMAWDTYERLWKNNFLLFLTAKQGKMLCGFVMYHVHRHLHHKTKVVAACDILAVKLALRGQGLGSQLMKAAEPDLKEVGTSIIIHNYRTCYDTEPLFPKHGYHEFERSYMKVLE